MTAAFSVVVGFLVGRWLGLLALASVWPIWLSGLVAGWWGNGISKDDSYQVIVGVFAIYTLVAAMGGCIGVLGRKSIRRSKGRFSHDPPVGGATTSPR